MIVGGTSANSNNCCSADSDCCRGTCCSAPTLCSTTPKDVLFVTRNNARVRFLKAIGGVTLFLSIIEAGVGGAVFTYLNSSYNCGAFWVSFLTFAAAACAIVSKDRDWIISACVFASFSTPVALVGVYLESGTFQHFSGIAVCRGGDGERYYASPEYSSKRSYCLASRPPEDNVCYCAYKFEDEECAIIALNPIDASTKMTCNNIFTTYRQTLAASIAFCTFLVFFLFILSLVSCVILCCPIPQTTNEPEPKEEPIEEYTFGVTHSTAFSVLNSGNQHLHANDITRPIEHSDASDVDQPTEHLYTTTVATL